MSSSTVPEALDSDALLRPGSGLISVQKWSHCCGACPLFASLGRTRRRSQCRGFDLARVNLQSSRFEQIDAASGRLVGALAWSMLHLVLSNPPYIPRTQVHGLDPVVRDHEPHLALSGGDDGLDCLRAIIDEAPRALAPGGWLLVEHHHDQSDDVLMLMRDAGLDAPQARPDLQGVMRFAMAQRPLRG